MQPTVMLNVVQSDPDDNRVIECAVAAGSQFIDTGEGDLLRVGQYRGTQIVRVPDFMELLPTL